MVNKEHIIMIHNYYLSSSSLIPVSLPLSVHRPSGNASALPEVFESMKGNGGRDREEEKGREIEDVRKWGGWREGVREGRWER